MQIREPEVNVSLKVRPLRSNWRAVKRTELSSSSDPNESSSCSPAKDQLIGEVWKTKVVKTEFVSDGPEGHTICESESEDGSTSQPGVVAKCTCKKCQVADDLATSIELSPNNEKCVNPNRSDPGIEPVGRLSKAKRRKPKPNPESREEPKNPEKLGWSKLYTDTFEPSPHIPNPPPPTPADSNPQMPLVRHPTLSPSSSISVTYPLADESNPPLIPIRRSGVEPPNVLPAPAADETGKSLVSSMIESVADKMTMSTNTEKSKKKKNKKNTVLTEQIPTPPQMPSPPPSKVDRDTKPATAPKKAPVITSTKSDTSLSPRSFSSDIDNCKSSTTIIKKLEKIFYASETNMWMLVAIIILTILAYRSSVDQHTCYYDD